MKYLVMLLIFTGCFSKSDSPEGVLKDFVEARLERIVGRDFLIDHTTGKMRVSIESMNDEEFGKFADLSSYKKDSFKIISKSCQEKRCYLTYSLGYRKRSEGKTSWTSEVKKIAEVLWIEGKWLISDVSNIKTYHETSESIEVNP
ncbi:MAG: hypothetical protein K2P81_12730 [Bacteriovoracaceae bacterium]|nr:hypothetical protein [Bacteriovoracaceae bacterium]